LAVWDGRKIGSKKDAVTKSCELAQAPPEKVASLQYVNTTSLVGVQHRLVGLAAAPQQDNVWTGPKYRRRLLKLPDPQSTRFDTPDTGLCVGKGVIVQIVQEVRNLQRTSAVPAQESTPSVTTLFVSPNRCKKDTCH
jgi:hypothetical protein